MTFESHLHAFGTRKKKEPASLVALSALFAICARYLEYTNLLLVKHKDSVPEVAKDASTSITDPGHVLVLFPTFPLSLPRRLA